MKILKADLDSAVEKGIVTSEQAHRLWEYFEALRPEQARFQGLYVLYYFGGLLIFSSMSWFLTMAWESGPAIMFISGVFAATYLLIGQSLWNKKELMIPGGLLVTAAVGLAPVFIFGLEKTLGIWPQDAPGSYRDYHVWVKGSWFFMELGTILAAVLALRFIQFTFLTFPLALSLWYMSMDLTPLIFGKNEFTWDERKMVSCLFGLVVLIGAFFVDRRFKKIDFAYWTYIYGMLAFWGGLSAMESQNEFSKFIYCLLNIGFIIISVYLRRKVFLVFGTIGVIGYIGHLSWQVFKDSMALPLILAMAGGCVLYLGVKYQRNKKEFESIIEKCLPTFLMKWRPMERG